MPRPTFTHIAPDLQTAYTLVSMGAGSSKYGPCTVCGKPADTCYCLTAHHAYPLDAIDHEMGYEGETGWSGGASKWGHRECLEKCMGDVILVMKTETQEESK